MKTISILSGKGGVGKSSISASLAIILSKKNKIVMADCDVDAPNLALVLGLEKKDFQEWESISTNRRAVFDLDKCNSCKKCFHECYFEAIAWQNNKPKIKEMACEGCEVCKIVCPQGAIKMEDVYNAKIGHGLSKYGFKIAFSQLTVGESGSGKLVNKVKEKAMAIEKDADIMLIDSSAGIGCPVIASVSGSDYCVLLTEPSPSGFHDMQRALELVKHFQIPYGIIINKFDLSQDWCKKIEQFAKKEKAQIIAKIPYTRDFSKALVNMIPIVKLNKNIEKIFNKIDLKI